MKWTRSNYDVIEVLEAVEASIQIGKRVIEIDYADKILHNPFEFIEPSMVNRLRLNISHYCAFSSSIDWNTEKKHNITDWTT